MFINIEVLNMKNLFLIITVLLAFQFVEAEPSSVVEVKPNDETTTQKPQTGGVFGNEYEVVPSQLSKSELWINAKKWISSSFRNYKHTVDMEDKESGTIILKFTSSLDFAGGIYVKYKINATLKIDIRENKYRYTFSDVTYSVEPSSFLEGNLSYLPKDHLEEAEIYLLAAKTLAYRNSVSPSLKNDIISYKREMENTKKYKNEKDEKKNKVTKEYKKAEAKYEIAQSIESGYNSMRSEVGQSLKEAMEFKDDF